MRRGCRYVQALAHWKGRWHDLLSGHKSADRKSREIRECEPRYSTHRSAEGGTPLFQVTLHLPPSAPLHHVTGDRCPTRAAAKDSAVLRGIAALWGKGVFGDNLRPTPPKALLVCPASVVALSQSGSSAAVVVSSVDRG